MQPPIYRHLPSLPEWLLQEQPPQASQGRDPSAMADDCDPVELPDPAEVLEMLEWWKTHIRGDHIAPAMTIEDEEATTPLPQEFDEDRDSDATARPLPSCSPAARED